MESLDPKDVERAKTFWAGEDADQVFTRVLEYVDHLSRVLKTNMATDKEYIQGLKLLESLDLCPSLSSHDSSVLQVVIGSGGLLPSEFPSCSSSPLSSNGPSCPASRDQLLSPLTTVQLQYQPHLCSKACLPGLPSLPLSMPPFWGQNPLKMPLLCGFKRLSASPLMMSSPGVEAGDGAEDWDVVYKAPCGKSLRDQYDVMRFLLATESYYVLQVDFFTFNPCVRLDPPPLAGPRRPEVDLSRGLEPTPVDLCVEDDGARPADFRYRKDRWPHGCFLSRDPALFKVCCDCTDGCSDAKRCACANMTTGGRHYQHNRLEEPVESGVFECGPWCGCDRARCQNRLVQRGIRVRLQVFQTEGRGWGVRCRDDLERGTFICIYAGVILRRVRLPVESPPTKQPRADLPSDDDVEVVTEWLAPSGRSDLLEPSGHSTSSLHVTVIQRSSDANNANAIQDRDQGQSGSAGQCDQSPRAANPDSAMDDDVNCTKAVTKKSLKREMVVDDVNFLDASKEGNVGRFINHSCQPNLFIQNVFTDSHDAAFPVIAFFTRSVVKAGAELTWDYSADTHRKQAMVCLCGSDNCQSCFTVEEELCDECQVEEQ